MASPSWGPFCSLLLHFPCKQPSREMTHASLGAPFLATANPGINLITRSSLRGWGSEAPRGITSCPRLLGRIILPGRSPRGPPTPAPEGPSCSHPALPQDTCSDPRVAWDLAPGPRAGVRAWSGELHVAEGEEAPLGHGDTGRQPRIFFTSPGMGTPGCPWASGGAPRAELGEF